MSMIVDLVSRLLLIYQREPDAAMRALDDPTYVFTDEIVGVDKMIRSARNRSASELQKRTLIETDTTNIEQLTALAAPTPTISFTPEKWHEWVNARNDETIEQRIERDNQRTKSDVDQIRRSNYHERLLSFFLERLDVMVEEIEKFDDTHFAKLMPKYLVAPFRECHINFVLGNYHTVCILCGSLLERAMKDLVVTVGSFEELLEEAQEDRLLDDCSIDLARDIYKWRTGVVHGKKGFDIVSVDKASELLDKTRNILGRLYHSRLED